MAEISRMPATTGQTQAMLGLLDDVGEPVRALDARSGRHARRERDEDRRGASSEDDGSAAFWQAGAPADRPLHGDALDRLARLRRILPLLGEELASVRREAARLRLENKRLLERLSELECAAAGPREHQGSRGTSASRRRWA